MSVVMSPSLLLLLRFLVMKLVHILQCFCQKLIRLLKGLFDCIQNRSCFLSMYFLLLNGILFSYACTYYVACHSINVIVMIIE